MKIDLGELQKRIETGAITRSSDGNGLTVWCYTRSCQYDKMWDDYTKLARGIVTDAEGNVVSRPFTKFFNLGEMQEMESLPWSEPVEVTEKIDGSLIIVSFYEGKMVVNTKGSFNSEQAEFARKWIEKNLSEWVEMMELVNDNIPCTYLFEAIYPDDRKVVDYGSKKALVLLAIIQTDSGRELSYEMLQVWGERWGVEVAPRHDSSKIEELLNAMKYRKAAEGEGVVIHFTESNLRVKVKGDEYKRVHRMLSRLSEKRVIENLNDVCTGGINTINAGLPDEFYPDIRQMTREAMIAYNNVIVEAAGMIPELRCRFSTRKEQAAFMMSDPERREMMGIVFDLMDGKDCTMAVWKKVKQAFKDAKNDKPLLEDDE